jgi:hypothetical protein
MLRYFFAFLLFFLLGSGASAAAIAAGAPASAKVAFLVCLGLFVAAIVDGVAKRRPLPSSMTSADEGIARGSHSSAVPGDLLHPPVD